MGSSRRSWFDRLGKSGKWLVGVIVVAIVGALAAKVVERLLEKPPLKATLENVDRQVGITAAEFSRSTEIASRTRGGARADGSFVIAMVGPSTFLAEAEDPDEDADGVPDTRDNCLGTPASTRVDEHGCADTTDPDEDADGVPDTSDNCPGTPASTRVDEHGCAATTDPDEDADGVPDTSDNCPGTPASTRVDEHGCAATTDPDEDADGVPDSRDNCPGTRAGTAVGDDGCPLMTGSAAAKVKNLTNCSEDELEAALQAATDDEQRRRPACTSVVDLAQGLAGGDSTSVERRAKAILSVLRSTRKRRTATGARHVGVGVSFELTLEGFDGHTVEVRWSLYAAGRPVSKAWLRDHPVLEVTGERDKETLAPEFWVPLPKQRARYVVRIEVFDEHDERLAYKKTQSFR